jgi:hypothetical protein
MNIKTLKCLKEYLFKEKKYNNIIKRNALKIYMHQIMKVMNLYFEEFIMYL